MPMAGQHGALHRCRAQVGVSFVKRGDPVRRHTTSQLRVQIALINARHVKPGQPVEITFRYPGASSLARWKRFCKRSQAAGRRFRIRR